MKLLSTRKERVLNDKFYWTGKARNLSCVGYDNVCGGRLLCTIIIVQRSFHELPK